MLSWSSGVTRDIQDTSNSRKYPASNQQEPACNRAKILGISDFMAKAFYAFLAVFFFSLNSSAGSLQSFWEKQTTVKTLPTNGLTLVYVYRPGRPTFSASVFFQVGFAQDPPGKGGLAHMFEHMAFMGTQKIGTFNYPEEKEAVEETERHFQAYNQARLHGVSGKDLAPLEQQWRDSMKKAEQYVNLGEFDRIASEAGCPGLDAYTAANWTRYASSFPNNQFEMWAYLESERWLHPVIARKFYSERDVVGQEYINARDQPDFQIREAVFPLIFKNHPYGHSGLGTQPELQSISVTDAQPFYQRYYTPANMVVAVVGGVPPEQGLPIAEAYFGRLPRGPKPDVSIPNKLPQQGELRKVLFLETRPSYIEFYVRPGLSDPNHTLYALLAQVLLTNPNALLKRKLVEQQKVAEAITLFEDHTSYEKNHALFGIQIFPRGTHSLHDLREALHRELENFTRGPLDEAELQIGRNLLREQAMKQLEDNDELAMLFGRAQLMQGDWRAALRDIDGLDQITPRQLLIAAQQMLVPTNRTATWVNAKKEDKNKSLQDK